MVNGKANNSLFAQCALCSLDLVRKILIAKRILHDDRAALGVMF